MKAQIFYFTGTGNSLKIAKDLADELGGADVVNIAKIKDVEVCLSGETIGIVCPVYAFGLPFAVVDFIKKIKDSKDRYFFAVVNFGGMGGSALHIMEKTLAERGIALSSGFGIKMPDNYIPWMGEIDKEGNEKILEQEEQRIKQIASIIKEKREHKKEFGNVLTNVIGKAVHRLFTKHMNRADKKFWVNDKCNSCGICARICPSDNVKLENGKPKWDHKCQFCLACIQWCPSSAIQYGEKSVGKGRYHNSRIDIKEMMLS
ncbi:MAG TPA: EFR1 family ferrodoxin [Candidatus Omnitrophota bacterium]|nr:EFR1 family ferrodoxin [Candidatus Omnitrophota bacterium]HPS19585.1 EFR1 family ferrodoxin [Candidatus Omnitrophota bacterium]